MVNSSNQQNTLSCPALFFAAPASGQGKTTITAAIARFHKNAGRTVRVFKTGPDYLDPQVLEQASGQAVEMLDLWMSGIELCQQKLYSAALEADIILVEGAMGMFDGEPSSADLAASFGIPIAIVMDVKGMAQTAAALALGLVNFRDDYTVAGLIANNCGSERHAQLIRDALPSSLPLLATLARNDAVTLPERHLGLVQASECRAELEQCFESACQWIGNSALTQLPKPVNFKQQQIDKPDKLLAGVHIAIAKDAAFTFIYADNIQLLKDLGAQLSFFSPLMDKKLPNADALWLPGGYPELHAKQLSTNPIMIASIQSFFNSNRPLLAECGGMLYCMQTLTDLNEQTYSMTGLINGHGSLRGRRGCQGMQTAMLPEGEVRAHAHHRSQCVDTPTPLAFGKRQRHPAPGEAIYRERALTASYLHLFFPSNPVAIAKLFTGQVISLRQGECG
ncbi:MAG: cobyrinate a,c-diamide synthase [Spongiibacteraceae bacterium]|nr:cobyrinate a,c-diamide synthase [Spongiibacteraceae bacterium]